MAEKQRRYCKNKTPGTRRGRKWDEKTRTGVLMDMITSNNICAVARKWGVPESTIRTWQAEELKKPESVFEQARREYARQVAAAAASAALDHIGYISRRVSANRTNAEIYENLKGACRKMPGPETGKTLGKTCERRRTKRPRRTAALWLCILRPEPMTVSFRTKSGKRSQS